MNKEDFVSLECAKLLKEKGFDEPCCAFYADGKIRFNASYSFGENIFDLFGIVLSDNAFAAPTFYESALNAGIIEALKL